MEQSPIPLGGGLRGPPPWGIGLIPNFEHMSPEHKLLTILCPSNVEIALCVSKYLKIISETRTKLDQGLSDTMLLDYCKI